jgi:hypothetical protein
MKEIILTQGKVALVDDEDFIELNKYKWYAHHSKNKWYAIRYNKGYKNIKMHRQILNFPKETDHINGNGLDNQRSNLRICNHSQNMANMEKRKNATSHFKGVTFHKKNRKWIARLGNNGGVYIGSFTNETDAGKAYDEKAKELYNKFSNLNFKEKDVYGNNKRM